MKIVTVVGARPQFIKAAVVSREILQFNQKTGNQKINEIIVHTGQHYDSNMSDIFFEEMMIPLPDYHLGVGGSSHGVMTGKMTERIEEVLLKENPDLLLVYGDTNSTLAGALAASKLHIPVAHVEAGLRSFNMMMPEEINRVLTDRVSKFLFCPTDTAIKNLKNEGYPNKLSAENIQQIMLTGDVMYDAAIFYKDIAKPTETVEKFLDKYLDGFYLVTIHRAENTDSLEKLSNIFSALDNIAKRIPVIIPMHPRTKKLLTMHKIKLNNIITVEPVGYFDMITLLSNCKGVFTDSGGVQKEAFFFNKPCITLRDETEWVELVDSGFNCLVGTDYDKIIIAEREFIDKSRDFSIPLYGTGKSGEVIINFLNDFR